MDLPDAIVSGVTIEGDRVARYDLRSSSVILAANGHAANKRLVERWAPDVAAAEYFGAHGSTGEAIEWGLALGAQRGPPWPPLRRRVVGLFRLRCQASSTPRAACR